MLIHKSINGDKEESDARNFLFRKKPPVNNRLMIIFRREKLIDID